MPAGDTRLGWLDPCVLNPDAVYHVMYRGLARQATFRTPADYETFLQMPGETHALCAASRRGV